MRSNFVFALPGMMPHGVGEPDNRILTERDGSAKFTIAVQDKSLPFPLVKIAVYDARGRLRYYDDQMTHVMWKMSRRKSTDTIYYAALPECVFLPSPCRVELHVNGSHRRLLSTPKAGSTVNLQCKYPEPNCQCHECTYGGSSHNCFGSDLNPD